MGFTLKYCWLIFIIMMGQTDDKHAADTTDVYFKYRQVMVDSQIIVRGVKDKRVLEAMRKVPRHEFVPEYVRRYAYEDEPQPIGNDQTISQPYIVALMTELLELEPDSKVLEIGTGSGYQAAILAELCDSVSTIEIIRELADRADSTFTALGYDNIEVRCGDGFRGWPEKAPFDAIIVTAAPDEVPEPLIEQLAEGGRLVIPVGTYHQDLKLIRKTEGEIKTMNVIPVRFVPMTGEADE